VDHLRAPPFVGKVGVDLLKRHKTLGTGLINKNGQRILIIIHGKLSLQSDLQDLYIRAQVRPMGANTQPLARFGEQTGSRGSLRWSSTRRSDSILSFSAWHFTRKQARRLNKGDSAARRSR